MYKKNKRIESEEEKLFELFASKNFEEIVTFDEISIAIERDFLLCRISLENVRLRLEEECYKSFLNIRKVGYKILHPKEHVITAKKRFVKSQKQINRGLHTLVYTDTNVLSDLDRSVHDIYKSTYTRLKSFYEKERRDLREETKNTYQEHENNMRERERNANARINSFPKNNSEEKRK